MVKDMERANTYNYEQDLRRRLGMVLIKPDAIEFGIAEELIQYMTDRVHNSGMGELNGAYIIQLQRSDISDIYSTVKEGIGEVLKDYLTEDISVLVTYSGNKKEDIWNFLHELRGTRLMDRTAEKLDKPGGLNTGVRDIIPLPGTRTLYSNAFEKLKIRIQDQSIPFSDEEYRIYCRNLVHVPDDLHEFFSLMKLLREEEIEQNIPISEYIYSYNLLQRRNNSI